MDDTDEGKRCPVMVFGVARCEKLAGHVESDDEFDRVHVNEEAMRKQLMDGMARSEGFALKVEPLELPKRHRVWLRLVVDAMEGKCMRNLAAGEPLEKHPDGSYWVQVEFCGSEAKVGSIYCEEHGTPSGND